MNRQQLLKEIRKLAKDRQESFSFDASKGKGGHGTVIVGGRKSVIPSGEIKTGTRLAILKQLGLK